MPLSWTAISGGHTYADLGDHVTRIFQTSNGGDFAGLNKGGSDIFVIKLDAMGEFSSTTGVPTIVSLNTVETLQLSPNPTTCGTTIYFLVTTPSQIRIDVVNNVGYVCSSITEVVTEPGPHTLHIDNTTLPAGMYYVRATAEAGVLTTQVLIIR